MAITEAQRDRALEIHNLWKTRMETAESDILNNMEAAAEVYEYMLNLEERLSALEAAQATEETPTEGSDTTEETPTEPSTDTNTETTT